MHAATAMILATPGSLEPAGPAAEAAADLWWLMLGLGAAVFVLFAVLLVRSLTRTSGATGAETSTGESGRLIRWWVVAGGVALPLVVIIVVFGATLVAMRDTPRAAAADGLVIEVVGHQFWYEIHYPAEGITTANEIHLPVGRPVTFELTSADVIHSFWVPALGGKLDMLPDGTNTLVLEADEPGEHRSRCAEFCGLQHTRMGMIVVAEPEEDFASWVEQQRRPADAPASEAEVRGQEVFLGAGCASCHAVDGTSAGGGDGEGPDLTHLASRQTLAAAMLPNEPAELADWIRDPQAIKPGVDMPATELSAREIDDLVAYLEGLE